MAKYHLNVERGTVKTVVAVDAVDLDEAVEKAEAAQWSVTGQVVQNRPQPAPLTMGRVTLSVFLGVIGAIIAIGVLSVIVLAATGSLAL